MTQPPPANETEVPAGTSSVTLDNTDKCRLLRQLLYDISTPKTPKATTCIFPLKNLLKARALVDDILQDERCAIPVATLYTKLDEIAAQVGELSKAQSLSQRATQTQNVFDLEPPHTALDNAALNPVHVPHRRDVKPRSYADAAAATAPTCPHELNTKNMSLEMNEGQHIATSRPPSTTAPSVTRDSNRIIMRFTTSSPTIEERLEPCELRNRVNEALTGTHTQVSGAEFTQAGHIALTPHIPCTTSQLLQLSDIYGPHIAHNREMDEIVFEPDRPWHSAVIRGIEIPWPGIARGLDIEGVTDEMRDEMMQWNATLQNGIKRLRLLCHPDKLRAVNRMSLMVSFDTKEGYEKVIQEGVFMYGKHCNAMPYRRRQH
jgi:hypothetical protein